MKPVLNYFEQIEHATNIAILVHKGADMDALGSAIALKRLIKKNCKPKQIDIFTDTANINENDLKKNMYAVFTKNENINKKNCKEYDLAICLDTSNRKLLGCYDKIFKKAKDTLNIDHHQSNTIYANKNIVVPKCSSACELIYQLLIKIRKLKHSDDILRLLYAGIITDTNNLANNLGRNTFKIIDDISGNDPKKMEQLEKIRNYFFKNETKAKFALLGKALQSIKYACGGKVAMMKITKQDFVDTNAVMTDTLGIVDYATKLQGVEVACMFIKQKDNTYYVSLRSKNQVNVGKIAQKLGGGGHDKIAAFPTKHNEHLTDVKNKILSLCQEQLKIEDTTENFEELFMEE